MRPPPKGLCVGPNFSEPGQILVWEPHEDQPSTLVVGLVLPRSGMTRAWLLSVLPVRVEAGQLWRQSAETHRTVRVTAVTDDTVTMETVSHRTPARIGQRSTTTRQSFTDRYVQIMDTQ